MDTTARAGLRTWLGLVALVLPATIISMDMTVLHLATPHLAAALQPTSTELLWIVDIYGFAIAALLVTMGTIGDRVGRRRLLMIGGVLFAGASIVAALSTSPAMLIAARALLGLTGATLLPSTLALLTNMFRNPTQRRIAIALWTTGFSFGAAAGPLIGGALLERFWWGSVFLIAVPVMVLMLVTAPLLVPEFKDPENAGRADLLSVLLSMGALLPIVYGIKELAKYGPQMLPIVMIAAGFALGAVFLRRQRILTRPLIDISLFSRRPFSVSLASQTLGLFAQGAIQFLIMQYLQLVLGMSPLEAGLWTVGPLLMGIVGSLMAPRVARITSQVYGLAFGFGLAAGGFLLILPGGLGWTVVGFTLTSFGINLGMVLVYDMILASAPRERAGTASGMAETGNELGIALGIAVIGSLSTAVYRGQVTETTLPGVPTDAVDTAREGVGNAAAVAAELPTEAADQMLRVSQDAFSSGVQTAAGVLAVVTAGIAIAGVTLLRGRHAPPSDDTDASDAPQQPGDAGDEQGNAPNPVG